MKVKLTAHWVLGFDGVDHVLYENGQVIVDGGTIIAVGQRTNEPAESHEDFGAALIAPGFIDLNALGDVDTTILGFGGKAALDAKSWSANYAGRARDVLTLEQIITGARGSFCQAMLSGVTTALPVTSLLFRKWAENGGEFDAIAGLAGELGIRLFMGPSFRSSVNVVDRNGQRGQIADEAAGLAGLADAISVIERNSGAYGGLVSGLLVPSTIETCSDALLLRTAAAAEALGVPFRLHCCQSKTEAELIWERSGKSSIAHLRDLRVLSRRALLPHALELGGPGADPALVGADRAALAASGATVVHCPLVVGRGGRRLESFGLFRDEGIQIGMGTDTAPPNMLMNLQIGLAMARIDKEHAVGPADYFRAATLGGAQALGRRDLGRLEKGAAADIVVWNLSVLDAQPIHDPIEALILMPPGLRAQHVWIAGRKVVRDGTVVGIDEARLSAAMQSIFEELRESFAERHAENRPWRSQFPSSFQFAGEAETLKL